MSECCKMKKPTESKEGIEGDASVSEACHVRITHSIDVPFCVL